MNRNTFVRRRHTHVGVINQQMWSAHSRRLHGSIGGSLAPRTE
jgi:hypothetical protein